MTSVRPAREDAGKAGHASVGRVLSWLWHPGRLTCAHAYLKAHLPACARGGPASNHDPYPTLTLGPRAEEESEEELLARLGVRLEAQVAALAGGEGGGFSDAIARTWAAQEQARRPARRRPRPMRARAVRGAGACRGARPRAARPRRGRLRVQPCAKTMSAPAPARQRAWRAAEGLRRRAATLRRRECGM